MCETFILADGLAQLGELTSFGAAGMMGAMWLWERRTSQKREQQIDESHARIIGDRVQLEELIGVIKQNIEAFTRLSATQEQLLRKIDSMHQTETRA